ncbi:unnamed protein product [Hymenolepis diminuta]|nr:unnamed protein product [Hymenolepis diminuta]
MNTYVAISALVTGILLAVTLSEAQYNRRYIYPRYSYGHQSWPDSGQGFWSYGGDIWGDSNRYSWSDNGRRDISHDGREDSGRDSDASGDEVVSVGGGDKINGTMQIVLDLHNEYRRQVATGKVSGQPAGSNIHDLKWNSELAKKAQEWANKCIPDHDSKTARRTSQFRYVGQNIAYNSDVQKGIKEWFDEHVNFNYYANKCAYGKVCGHYTQLVWAKTTDLGCGINMCDYKGFKLVNLVCNYGTA